MFQWLVEKSLASRLVVLVAAAVLMVWGSLQATRLPVDVFPDLNKPTVTIMTEAGGMAPEEIEQLISFPLETAMSGQSGVATVRSISSAGLSIVYLTFDWQVDVYRARQMVSERLTAMESALPPGAVPRMGPVSSIMGEIMLVAIPIYGEGADPRAAREYADWVLRPRLMAIAGVSQVIPIGGEVRQFQVQPDTRRMMELGIGLDQIETAVRGFAANTSGGFLELNGREYLIRHLGRSARLEDLKNLAITARNGQPILLRQVAEVGFAAAIKRGDGGFDNGREGGPAVILSIQKQPTADTVDLTKRIESALADLKGSVPRGMNAPQVIFRQADFIEASLGNLQVKLLMASCFVAGVLFFFLGNLRTMLISLTAIPLSILTAILVFKWLGLSINTMTLGGLAIAIGELVDDAVVDIENILRRLREKAATGQPYSVRQTVIAASLEVRTAIVYATLIIALVFVPLFALPGIEGRLFVPLGVAYIVSILASLAVSVLVTPVLASYLLPALVRHDHGETRLVGWLKAHYRQALARVLAAPRLPVALAGVAVVLATLAVPFFPTTFLPPFNEGSITLGLRLNPGATLSESIRIAQAAEHALRGLPELEHMGRRTGRAELDEHAEGVHVTEFEIKLKPGGRPKEAVYADIRQRLKDLPASLSLGQPIAHRIDHMLSGVRAQIAIRIVGEDLDTLRAQAGLLRERLTKIPGLADLEIEKQVLAPQIKVRVDFDAAARYGISTAQLTRTLQTLVDGEKVTQIVEGNRRFDLVVRLPETARSLEGLAGLLIETPGGRIPLSRLASIEDADGPNQITRDEGRRRIVISANVQDRALSEVVADLRAAVAEFRLPEGYFITLGGQFQAQEEAARLIALLAIGSAVLIFMVLYSRYRSAVLAAMIMANVPLALVGSVIGLWLSGQPLSVAALIGFITLAGIATRNGILKISHYLNLMRFEGEVFGVLMIIRGSLERLTPVLMTALVAAFALAPLLFEAEQPGTEILHPVAVVIFSGLVSSTLLDTFVTPALFWLFGCKPAERLLAEGGDDNF
ncbi:efflux RND transporter permease subunit [Dechloromonas sp.]|uniref:efflux RND transporter permease subunit n=1 Tax=Dechloromonas sp. TaxID=1917218 RepID=UPI00121E20F8|nr:efflux RND transporter permease subunit [Dechloromonas sp.]MBU3698203.1 efflux RND transporter permease subunit [Dechloromonas sp.]TEX47457.1 MAG: CusA/CzcA family heavy metal efflux RND transporter [Rhodocyclaceae bacterium]